MADPGEKPPPQMFLRILCPASRADYVNDSGWGIETRFSLSGV